MASGWGSYFNVIAATRLACDAVLLMHPLNTFWDDKVGEQCSKIKSRKIGMVGRYNKVVKRNKANYCLNNIYNC